MSWKSISQHFEGYFYKDNIWSPIFAKHIVWSPKFAIFSQELPPGTFIQVSHVAATSSVPPADNLPPEISRLLQEFSSVFDPPQGYPPRRDCEHDIPLLPGATPVSMRPYRYPPAMKDRD